MFPTTTRLLQQLLVGHGIVKLTMATYSAIGRKEYDTFQVTVHVGEYITEKVNAGSLDFAAAEFNRLAEVYS